jgi:hypothetical protein
MVPFLIGQSCGGRLALCGLSIYIQREISRKTKLLAAVHGMQHLKLQTPAQFQ